MATARRGRSSRPLPLGTLPSAAETSDAIRQAARRLGLLIDLHRVAERLRDLDAKTARSST